MDTKKLHTTEQQSNDNQALEHTKVALAQMAELGIRPEGHVEPFLSPDARQKQIDVIPYQHQVKQVVVYETMPGELSAVCPFSGLADFGTLRIEYIPGTRYLELKSLKYYILSWRRIGIAQEDITALIYNDILKTLQDPKYLFITTVYNVRGGINTTCSIDSRNQ
ncbi:MAG TPA: preQ(1) synthase [Flavisolibacter sp.]|nr:preQ(1) synthase [Flavisolibacter sp.]